MKAQMNRLGPLAAWKSVSCVLDTLGADRPKLDSFQGGLKTHWPILLA